MSYTSWLDFLRELSKQAGSLEFFDWDSTPLEGLLLNIDGYSASRSKLPWMSWSDWGWKATIASICDIVASGGRPLAVMYSIGVKSMSEALEIARGVGEASRWAGAIVVKSDTNESLGDYWIDVAVVGSSKRPVSRRGARPGHLLIQVGALGYGLLAELALNSRYDISSSPRVLEYTRRPKPPIAIGQYIGECGASASIDNSDGWIASLYAVSKASGVKIVVEEVVGVEEASQALRELGLGLETLLYSSEDYNLAVVASRENADCILDACRRIGVRECQVIGRVEEGEGVYFKSLLMKPAGWTWL